MIRNFSLKHFKFSHILPRSVCFTFAGAEIKRFGSTSITMVSYIFTAVANPQKAPSQFLNIFSQVYLFFHYCYYWTKFLDYLFCIQFVIICRMCSDTN